jgi:PDZ domain-containing protein
MDGLAPPTTDGAPPDSADEVGAVPSPPPPPLRRRKLPKWPFVLAGFLLVVGTAVGVAWPINVPYFALSPGPANDVTDFISVEDPGVETGDLLFLTVTLKEVNLLEYLGAWLDDEVDLSPRETIRPTGVTPEQLRIQNLSLMEQSKQNAVFVALTRLGYEVTFEGTGALIGGVIPGSAADGVLEVDDVLVEVNGSAVEFSTDAVQLISGFRPGEAISLVVERRGDAGELQRLAIPITLGVFMAEDDDGNPIVDADRGMVGVLLSNAPTNISFPVEVDIDSQNIGGPSAGLMFALEIMNQLTDDDLTAGRRIAGTGTIDQDGVVGPIGGIRQKVFGAIDAGAEYVLVPREHFEEAATAAGDDVEVVAVGTIDDALSFLSTLSQS